MNTDHFLSFTILKTIELYFEKVWAILKVSSLLVCLLVFFAFSFHFNSPYFQNEPRPMPMCGGAVGPYFTGSTEYDSLSMQAAKGKELFEGNCTVCHAIDKIKVGPALRDISKRRPIKWIRRFVRNSQKVIRSGDPYAVKLNNEYAKTEMTAFPSFTNEEIDAIVEYIGASSLGVPLDVE